MDPTSSGVTPASRRATVTLRAAPRPLWMSDSRTYPLLEASGGAISDLVETRRGSGTEAERPARRTKAQ